MADDHNCAYKRSEATYYSTILLYFVFYSNFKHIFVVKNAQEKGAVGCEVSLDRQLADINDFCVYVLAYFLTICIAVLCQYIGQLDRRCRLISARPLQKFFTDTRLSNGVIRVLPCAYRGRAGFDSPTESAFFCHSFLFFHFCFSSFTDMISPNR